MSYIPGSAIIFQIERISDQVGLAAPYSIVRAGTSTYFYSNRGFQKIDPGGFPQPIGREKVDRTFLADLDTTNLQLFMGASDPRSTRVYWAYKSGAGAVNGSTTRSSDTTRRWIGFSRSRCRANTCSEFRKPA
jgi:hypothetical protein